MTDNKNKPATITPALEVSLEELSAAVLVLDGINLDGLDPMTAFKLGQVCGAALHVTQHWLALKHWRERQPPVNRNRPPPPEAFERVARIRRRKGLDP